MGRVDPAVSPMTAKPPLTTQQHAFEVLQQMDRYNGWIASQFRCQPPGRLLEVGAGIGNLTRWFLDAKSILAIDLDPMFLGELKDRLGNHADLTTAVIDVTDPARPLGGQRFDTIIMVNVLEHVADDEGTLRMLSEHLAPNGRLHILVPAHPALYGEVDRQAGHVRRYRREELGQKIRESGLQLERLRHFNMLGAAGWWVNICLLRRKYLPANQSKLMDWFVPLLKLEERISPPFGLSLIATGVKRPLDE
jgi:2-polyprenyl-3-methyl-5-hydroxy-6-metoxy-1,4-benzoquinol methylase